MRPSSRRLAFVLAAMIAVLAGVIAALPTIQGMNGPGDFSGPAIVPRPVVLAILLGLPAALAAIAALHASRPLLIAAGALCLLQSFVSFGGVTLGFVIPAVLLIALGLERGTGGPARGMRRREWVAGLLVMALGVAAWIAPFARTETVCWVARSGPDGSLVYTQVPESDTMTLGLNDLAGGCDGGAFTIEGLLLGGVLAIGAVAMAGLAARTGDTSRTADAAPA